MKIAVAVDHAGWPRKADVVEQLRSAGHDVDDLGTDSDESCDYPDYAESAARAVSEGRYDQAVLVCGTGIGMSMAANKIKGIRAAACQSPDAARYSRTHNDANVLCLGARLNSPEEIHTILEAWTSSAFTGGRHARRVRKINALDRNGA